MNKKLGSLYKRATASRFLVQWRVTHEGQEPFIASCPHFEGSLGGECTARVYLIANGQRRFVDQSGPELSAAIRNALFTALLGFFPNLNSVFQLDSRVERFSRHGQDQYSVLLDFRNGNDTWTTVGVNEGLLLAFWEALVDGYLYRLIVDDKSLSADSLKSRVSKAVA